MRFAVLRTHHIKTGTLKLAVVLGEPNQLYSIRQEILLHENAETYFFSFHPIRQDNRVNKVIEGYVLEAAGYKFCEPQ